MTQTVVRDIAADTDDVPLTIDGRARSITMLADLLIDDSVPVRLHVCDTRANRVLRRFAAASMPLHRDDVLEPGRCHGDIRCAPLDRMISEAEIDLVAAAFRRVLVSGQFTTGPYVPEFEDHLADYLGVTHAIGTACGTDALIGALLAVGVQPGDEVIIPANSFPGTENAVWATGAIAVPADVRNDHTIDPESVRALITTRTRCVIPVHLYGRAADVRALAQLCVPHAIAIVEDAAQAIGLDDLGRFSDCAALSFNPYKNLGATGKAGAVLTNRNDVAQSAKSYLYHGFTPTDGGYRRYVKTGPFGLNARMDNTQAAALGARLEFLALNNLRRAVLARRYLAGLAPLAQAGLLRLPEPVADHVWHLFTVESPVVPRDEVLAALLADGIEADVYYPVLTHRQPSYPGPATDLPTVEAINGRVFQLPMFPNLSVAEQDRVITALHRAYGIV